jgi:hypothetical protein
VWHEKWATRKISELTCKENRFASSTATLRLENERSFDSSRESVKSSNEDAQVGLQEYQQASSLVDMSRLESLPVGSWNNGSDYYIASADNTLLTHPRRIP